MFAARQTCVALDALAAEFLSLHGFLAYIQHAGPLAGYHTVLLSVKPFRLILAATALQIPFHWSRCVIYDRRCCALLRDSFIEPEPSQEEDHHPPLSAMG